MTDHLITPPPELFKQWEDDILNERENVDHVLDCAWRDGYRAGADAELMACCEWLDVPNNRSDRGDGWLMPGRLRAARRPKPPSLAEQALDTLRSMQIEPVSINGVNVNKDVMDQYSIIRRALERLQELEDING